MLIQLFPGDNLWSPQGTHVCDERGIALVVTEDTEVDIADAVADRCLAIIRDGRVIRGLDPDTGLPPVAVEEPSAPVEE